VGLKRRVGPDHRNARRRFQTNPRGFEAYRGKMWETWPQGQRTGFRRTLVGLKHRERRRRRLPHRWFQTNPRGVEALRPNVRFETGNGFRRTLVGLKPSDFSTSNHAAGFRRTLVGLKPPPLEPRVSCVVVFQTNPRGVEAKSSTAGSIWTGLFQTNPRGVEAVTAGALLKPEHRFRRTLVGLKRG